MRISRELSISWTATVTIARVDLQGDSLKNGAIIGVLIGAPIGVVGSLFTGNIRPFLASTLGW